MASDEQFGEWLVTNNLSVAIKLSARGAGQWVAHSQLDSADWMERAAAMWAAANRDDFDTARVAGNARTHGPPGNETTLRRCAASVGAMDRE